MKKIIFVLMLWLAGCAANNEIGLVEGNQLFQVSVLPISVSSSKFAHRVNTGSRAMVALVCIPCSFAVDTKIPSQTAGLDNESLNAINSVLASSGSDISTSRISVDVHYEIEAGFMKKVALKTDWYVDNDDKTKNVHIRTIVVADKALDMFPDTTDEKYKSTFVDLAGKSAQDFLLIMAGHKPRYSSEDVDIAY